MWAIAKKGTRDELKRRGKKGETYDDIIRELLKAGHSS